jgi:subtilisin family serine protease
MIWTFKLKEWARLPVTETFRFAGKMLSAGWVLFSLWLAPVEGLAQTPAASFIANPGPAYREDRILIKPKLGNPPGALASFHLSQKGRVLRTFEGIGGLQVVSLPEGETVPGFIARYEQGGLVEFAEPDYARQAAATLPNDPKFVDGTLWGLNNYGQSGGTAHADIDAPEGWDVLNSASNIVVAVLDTGVRYTHEDLAANMWVNPQDGGHGFNAYTGTNNPSDDNGHGTLVAGVLGGVGNNGKGIAGVAWRVQIMACKCFDANATGNDSDIIACMDYARTNGARIINASWGAFVYSQAMSNAIASVRDAGIILVASCGNNHANVDTNAYYPACYGLDNVVSVAYTTRNDGLGSLSNYGATNVDLAAPGEQIYSSFFLSDTFYIGGQSGTSMAAPYVAGTLALMLAKFPAETHQQIINRVLNATDPLPALAGKCVTGGRLNLRNALSPPIRLTALPTTDNGLFQLHLSGGPNRTCVIQGASDLTTWLPLYTNTTSANGTFDFTDSQANSPARRFYRAVAAP